jgi:hypothetical protein
MSLARGVTLRKISSPYFQLRRCDISGVFGYNPVIYGKEGMILSYDGISVDE